MTGLRRLTLIDTYLGCWKSFPNLLELRLDNQKRSVPCALVVQWYVMRKLEHFAYECFEGSHNYGLVNQAMMSLFLGFFVPKTPPPLSSITTNWG